MHEVLVNCLFKLAQEKVKQGELTVAVDLGRKTAKKQNKQQSALDDFMNTSKPLIFSEWLLPVNW